MSFEFVSNCKDDDMMGKQMNDPLCTGSGGGRPFTENNVFVLGALFQCPRRAEAQAGVVGGAQFSFKGCVIHGSG